MAKARNGSRWRVLKTSDARLAIGADGIRSVVAARTDAALTVSGLLMTCA